MRRDSTHPFDDQVREACGPEIGNIVLQELERVKAELLLRRVDLIPHAFMIGPDGGVTMIALAVGGPTAEKQVQMILLKQAVELNARAVVRVSDAWLYGDPAEGDQLARRGIMPAQDPNRREAIIFDFEVVGRVGEGQIVYTRQVDGTPVFSEGRFKPGRYVDGYRGRRLYLPENIRRALKKWDVPYVPTGKGVISDF